MAPIRIEAESMTRLNSSVETGSFASGGAFTRVASTSTTGSISTAFSAPTGVYDVVIGYYDESDGIGQLTVNLDSSQLDSWSLNQNLGDTRASATTFLRRTVASGLTITQNSLIQIQGLVDGGEAARVDYIEFIPVSSSPSPSPAPAPAPAPAPTPTPAPALTKIRVEAEVMTRSSYDIESGTFASGGKFIKVGSSGSGTATTTFKGTTGQYDVVIGYYDENDGQSQLTLQKNGVELDSWTLDQDFGITRASAETFQTRTVARNISLTSGDVFKILGTLSGGEASRVDYIEFVPAGSATPTPTPSSGTINGTSGNNILTGDDTDNIINGLGGDDTLNGAGGDDTLNGGAGHDKLDGSSGSDTADYSKTANGIIANLSTGVVLAPIFGTASQPKIMPLGDSITSGQHQNAVPGAYRIQLWEDFEADDLGINFVGSQSNGPTSLGDKDHEGRPGWTVDQIKGLVNDGILNTYQPDVVLLMIGTNDTNTVSASTIATRISSLIDRIATLSPDTQIVVSTIAPIKKSSTRNQKATALNSQLPGLVNQKVAEGKKVYFANAGGSLSMTDLGGDGLHPSAAGYDKLGNAWYKSIVDRDTLLNVENIVGTAFKDKITGNSGVNAIEGGGGDDLLTGGGGADKFVYKSSSVGSDTITDFGSDDIFRISASGFGGGLVSGVSLSTDSSATTGIFVNGASAIGSSANFLYDNGILRFDPDGAGGQSAIKLATLNGTPSLSVSDFAIVA